MTTPDQIISLADSWVGQKITDPTNIFGGQCTTLVNQLMKRTTNDAYNLNWTHAKDGLTKAASQGLEVIYNDPNDANLIPKPGDFFVMQFGPDDELGHIGLCVSADLNGMQTIEQNIDGWKDENKNGQNDQLEVGGGGYTRRSSCNYADVIGWFRLPYEAEEKQEVKEVKEMIDTAYAIQLLEDLGNRKAGEIYIVNVGARTFKLQNMDTWNTIKDVFPEIKVLKATAAVNYLHASIQAWGLTEDK